MPESTLACPVLLQSDNFTPATRTPWGGHRIRGLKGCCVQPEGPVVGESWELSAGPEFPSRLADGTPLADWIAADPRAALGAEHHLGRSTTALLVKLLDADQPLSLQVHPTDHDPDLLPEETGKPEAWYVAHAEPGAVLFVGLQPGVGRAELAAAVAAGNSAVLATLRHVAVQPGDLLLVPPRTPHAIGPGVLLVEPQRVLPGRRGVTLRLWDWDRRFDAAGHPDPAGRPRALHLDRALDALFRDGPPPYWQALLRAGPPAVDGPATRRVLCGASPASGALPSQALHVERLWGSGRVRLPPRPVLRALTVLQGTVGLGELGVPQGRTVAIPAAWRGADVVLQQAHAIVASLGQDGAPT